MAISEFTIENLEQKIQECQKKIVINRNLIQEGIMMGLNNPKFQDEINKLKKIIIHYQRELSKKFCEKYPNSKHYPKDIEYTKISFD